MSIFYTARRGAAKLQREQARTRLAVLFQNGNSLRVRIHFPVPKMVYLKASESRIQAKLREWMSTDRERHLGPTHYLLISRELRERKDLYKHLVELNGTRRRAERTKTVKKRCLTDAHRNLIGNAPHLRHISCSSLLTSTIVSCKHELKKNEYSTRCNYASR